MNNFLFEDTINGGYFFVQCDTLEEAYEIIWEEIACDDGESDRDTYTMNYNYLNCRCSDAQAEAMGYDTY